MKVIELYSSSVYPTLPTERCQLMLSKPVEAPAGYNGGGIALQLGWASGPSAVTRMG